MLESLSNSEWLEADGLGGFAMGTASGVRTRRYHGLLLTAMSPPTGRVLLVSGFDAWVETCHGREAISTQCYRGDVRHPDGAGRLELFDVEPWPCWRYRLSFGAVIEQALFVPKGQSAVCLSWSLIGASDEIKRTARLFVRPLLAARDYHGLQHENAAFRFDADVTTCAEPRESRVVWRPYDGLPEIVSWSNGEYRHDPDWFRQFLYSAEAERGLDCLEDLASPGELSWDLSAGDAEWMLSAALTSFPSLLPLAKDENDRSDLNQREMINPKIIQRAEAAWRAQFPTALHRAADAYLVKRGSGHTIIAGYPWFTDWGRDTFIALRGLCLATGRLDVAKSILLSWAATVSDGMLPNRFTDHGEAPEFNAVDASLWFVIVVHEFLAAVAKQPNTSATHERIVSRVRPLDPPTATFRSRVELVEVAPSEEATLRHAVEQILNGYASGTRFGIRLDDDGLIAAGQPGVQLTWMDAKVGDWVVTPRIGKPVEIQALWLNALWADINWSRKNGQTGRAAHWDSIFQRGLMSFHERFWNNATGGLFDVVDVDHQPGAIDASFRPNQILAAGGLPFTLLPPDRAKHVVDAVAEKLWTPLGLRSLTPDSPDYVGRYSGSVWQRDAAYHQGTAWGWLIGSFVEAWIKTRDDPTAARGEANQRFVEPLLAHRYQAGLGHVSEIADGDEPQTPRGCPFQAWSVGELLRLLAINQTIR